MNMKRSTKDDKSPKVKIMKVKQVNYNWFFDPQNGESFSTVTVGKAQYPSSPIVTEIHEDLKPDRHCRVYFEDGSIRVISNLNEVFYEPDTN